MLALSSLNENPAMSLENGSGYESLENKVTLSFNTAPPSMLRNTVDEQCDNFCSNSIVESSGQDGFISLTNSTQSSTYS